MYIINTTVSNPNPGDALIRRGVLWLLGIEPRDQVLYYIDRGEQRGDGYGFAFPAWKGSTGCPGPDLVAHARALICAGTPEWLDRSLEWLHAALDSRVPVLICGAGQAQSGAALRLLRSLAERELIVGATVRDLAAQEFCRAAGVEAELFPCPATACAEDVAKGGLVITPRLASRGQRIDGASWAWWQRCAELYRKPKRVVVHEPHEWELAAELWPYSEPWYCSDPLAYAEEYSRAGCVIAGRLHAALPALACGAQVYALNFGAKARGALEHVLPQPTADGALISYADAVPIVSEGARRLPGTSLVAQRLAAQNRQHALYWARRMHSGLLADPPPR